MNLHVELKNKYGMNIVGILSLPENATEKVPVVAVSHGFMAYKEYKLLNRISEELLSKGIASLRFDFTNCVGKSEGKCTDMRISNQVSDLQSVIDHLSGLPEIDPDRIGLAGHSLGGTVSIIEAVNDSRIRSLVTVAAFANYTMNHLFTKELLEKWKKEGSIEFESPLRGKHEISYGFYDDMIRHNCIDAVKQISIPTRFIHGSMDKILDVDNAKLLYENANELKDLQIIGGADHLFLKDPYMTEASRLTAEWFEKTL